MFLELGQFIIKLLRLIIETFMYTNLGDFSFLTLLISACLLSVFLSNVIVNFSPKDIHFNNKNSFDKDDE